MGKPLIDLTGNKYGKLVVIKRDMTIKRPTSWLCKCECGNTKVIAGTSLTRGQTKSCGCQHYTHPFNEYRVVGDVVYISIKDKEMLIDKEDLNKIKSNRICLTPKGYALSAKGLIHRVITNCPDGMDIDHINHNKLDNRKSNLRIVTRSDNHKNRKPRSNTGYLGITFSRGVYVVQLDSTYIATCQTLNEAIMWRDKWLKDEGKEYAQNNYFLNFAR